MGGFPNQRTTRALNQHSYHREGEYRAPPSLTGRDCSFRDLHHLKLSISVEQPIGATSRSSFTKERKEGKRPACGRCKLRMVWQTNVRIGGCMMRYPSEWCLTFSFSHLSSVVSGEWRIPVGTPATSRPLDAQRAPVPLIRAYTRRTVLGGLPP